MEAAPEATMTGRPGTARLFPRLLSCIRLDEVVVLQGAPLLGAVFSMGRLTIEGVVTLLVFAAGSGFLTWKFGGFLRAELALSKPNRSGLRRQQLSPAITPGLNVGLIVAPGRAPVIPGVRGLMASHR